MSLTAVHVNWTSPYRHGLERRGGLAATLEAGGYRLPPEELVTTVHGALAWRRHHGPIVLVTDALGAAYAEEQGLDALYAGIDTALDALDGVDLDPIVYSTGAKIYAASLRPAPFAIIDTDLYLRRPLDLSGGPGFVFAHWESPDGEVYPDPAEVPNRSGADLSRWVFDTPAANMAVSVFLDEGHRAAYTEAALAYAIGNSGPDAGNHVVRAVFAEQRLAPAVARALGVDLRPVTPRFWLSERRGWDGPDHAALFHHTWHLKTQLRTFAELRPPYLRYLLEDVLTAFPEAAPLLLAMPGLAAHADLVGHTIADLEAHGPTVLGGPR